MIGNKSLFERLPRLFAVATAVAIGTWFCVFVADVKAQDGGSQSSSKATAACTEVALLSGPTTAGVTDGGWQTILRNSIKTSSQKDLIFDVSLECGLYTDTTVRSKGGDRDTSTAEAMIQVRVLVDGRVAAPGDVTFARRAQTLSAVFQGLLNDALSVDPLTGAVIIDESLLTPEEVQLVLDTMTANAFNFVMQDIGVGVHTIEVQARVHLSEAAQAGAAIAKATIGKGSMTVDEVRFVQGEDLGGL